MCVYMENEEASLEYCAHSSLCKTKLLIASFRLDMLQSCQIYEVVIDF